MLKRSLIVIACGAKALLIAAGLMTLPAIATADEDCPPCVPPSCYPGEPCWGES
jgi:hypothetical protein